MTPAPDDLDPPPGIEPRHRASHFEANRAIAGREARPKHLIRFASEVDLAEIERVRGRTPGSDGPPHVAFVVKALALALREFPQANRRIYRRGCWPLARRRIQAFPGRNIAISVETHATTNERTTSFVIIRDADALTLDRISDAISGPAARDDSKGPTARRSWGFDLAAKLSSRVGPHLLRLVSRSPRGWARCWGGAARVAPATGHGGDAGPGPWAYTIEASFGPSQVRPAARDAEVAARPAFALTMNLDRRVMPGAQAAPFFRRVVELLEHAEAELDRAGEPEGGGGA